MPTDTLTVNDVAYRWPDRPLVVVCIDGGDPEYIEHGVAAGIIPNIARYMREGFYHVAHGTMPSFTCPNNMSIVTGRPASVHGISGNFYLDRATNEPVVMTGPELLRVRSVMSEFSRHGAKVVSITAKDKLRKQLQKDMDLTNGSVSFSSQHADRCTLAENGIEDVLGLLDRPLPDMYSADLSLLVLDAGIELLRNRRPDILFLSLTDFIQHAFAPGHPEADQFYRDLDARFGALEALGATVALTADHGMSEKTNDDGSPRVVWLQDILDAEFGRGTSTVICPITDAFVGHHGALGGFVRVYCHQGLDGERVIEAIRDIPGLEKVWSRTGVASAFDLPLEPEGDVAVMGDARTVVGARAVDHDLSGLKGQRLRTHGSLYEADVPIILSRPIGEVYARRAEERRLHSYEVFDYAMNGTV
ncbi:MAG: phosphonoacetate hydrolase [Ectothiorhodospiraceae bacterium]|nr:phosphonoacetate hydrolase [Ectothiorhodospiraceae bacterium]